MFSIAAYTIQVKQSGNRKNVVLEKFDGKNSLLEVIHRFFRDNFDQDVLYAHQKKLMRFKEADDIHKNAFVLKVETGEYGFSSDLYHTTKKKNLHKRGNDEAEMLPFWVYLNIPKGQMQGTLIFQRFKQFGVRSYITDSLLKFFNQHYPGYILEIAKAVPSTVIDELLNRGQVKTFRFVKYQASPDICDAVASIDEDGVTTEVEYVIKAKRKSFFGMLDPFKKELKKVKPNLKGVVEIPNFDYDTIKVDIDISGTKRSVDLGKLFKISANIDVTNEIELGPNNHPTKESFKKLSAELAEVILE